MKKTFLNWKRVKKYHDYDYRIHLSIDEDYYKPIRTNSSFNDNYIEY